MKKSLILIFLVVLISACESAKDKADRFFLKGNVALNEGNNAEAIRMYNEAIKKNPKLKEAYNNKGISYYREGKLYEAIETYSYVLFNVDAYYLDAKRNRLNAYIDAGDFKAAGKDIDFFSDAYPDSSFLSNIKGIVMTKAKQFRMARIHFEEAYRKDSSSIQPLVNIANTYFYLSQNDLALQFLDSAERIDPSEPSIYNTRSMIAANRGNYDEAVDYANKAIQMDPNNAYFLNNRGYAYMKNGDLENAEKDINYSIQADHYNGWAYRNKGMLYNIKGDYPAAVRNFKLAIKYDSAIMELHGNYGNALFELDRKDEACVQWNISVDLFENDAREFLEKYCK